jgi:hypothetical protein
MSPNFSSALLKQDLDSVPKPTVLPTGTAYAGVITKYEYRKTGGASPQDILTYHVKLTEWSPEIDNNEKLDGTGKPINLASRPCRMDYFIESESGAYELAKMLKALGLKGAVEEAIPMAVGAQVVARGEQKFLEKTNDTVFNLKALTAPA